MFEALAIKELKLIKDFDFQSLNELFDFLAPWNDQKELNGFIFRGHSQENYKLIPNALRPENNEELWMYVNGGNVAREQTNHLSLQISAEFQLLREYYRLADQQGLGVPTSSSLRKNLAQTFDAFGERHNHERSTWIPEDLLESAALAQHYGIPTRLLDWTYDPYVAMYFAFQGALEYDGNIVIWALNKDHISFLGNTVNRINVEFVTPHYASNPNLNAQKGLFTHCPVPRLSGIEESQLMMKGQVQLVDRRPLDEIILEQAKPEKNIDYFKRIILPATEAARGIQVLESLGYGSSKIFPGYDGVAKQVLERCKVANKSIQLTAKAVVD
ncbi:MAG: hypothetical protein ACI81S_002324 [Sphingobacteriales bacterium]